MPRRFVPFGDFQRDGTDYDSPALNEAQNVLPVHGVYRPVRQARVISSLKIGNSITPWIHFDGTNPTSDVDFTANPLLAVPAATIEDATVIVRFRTSVEDTQIILGAGLERLVGNPLGFGWAMGTEGTSPGFVRVAMGFGSEASPTVQQWSRVQIPGGYSDGDWHYLALVKSGGLFNNILCVADGLQGGTALGSTVNTTDWNNLDMRWGQGQSGQQRFAGDVERVVTVSGVALSVQQIEEIMNSSLSNITDGGWTYNGQPGHLWLLRENTGVTVNDFGSADPGVMDGTMGANCTWQGSNFALFSQSGITGGLAHFYTAAQESLERGPVADVSKGLWRSFGGLPLPGEEPEEGEFPAGQFFSRLNEKRPDDSQGALLGIPPQGLSSPQEFEVKLEQFSPAPTVDTGHIVAFRYQFHGKPDEDGNQPFELMELSPSLYQGTTLIATLDTVTVTEADEEWKHAEEVLLTTEADDITNYQDLRVRFLGDIKGGSRQAAKPIEDINNFSGWVNEDGESEDEDGNGILWESINDLIPGAGIDLDTFAETQGIAPGATSRYRFKLSEIDDPRNPNGFNILIEAAAVDTGVDMTVFLREGDTGDSRDIASMTFTDIPTDPTEFAFPITSQQANTITEFNNLHGVVVFKSHRDPGGPSGPGVLPSTIIASAGVTSGNVDSLRTQDGNDLVFSNAAIRNVRVKLDDAEDPDTNANHQVKLVVDASVAGGCNIQFRNSNGVVIGDPLAFTWPVGTDQTVTIPIPESYVQQIISYNGLGFTVNIAGAVQNPRINLAELQFPGAGAGGRKARLYGFVLGAPSRCWIGVSWVRMFAPDPGARERNDITELYAGNYHSLYVIDESGFSDVSKAGGYAQLSIPRSWAMVGYGQNVIASNKVDAVQKRAPGDALFSDLITSTAKPRFAALAVCQGHLVGFNVNYTDTGQGSGGNGTADEWWASALDDPADFQVSLTTGANRKRILSPAGEIVGAVGGEFITVFKKDSVHRLDYVGFAPGQPTFRADVISSTAGTQFPRSIAQVDRDVYFLDNDGFKVVRNGQYVEDIGQGKVNRMVTDTAFELRAVQPIDSDEIPITESVVIGAYDQLTGLIWWALRATGREGGDPDPVWRNGTFVIYNPKEDRWSVIELIGTSPSPIDDFTATHLWTLPSQAEASTSMARGIGILSLDGAYPFEFFYRFKRFLGELTYRCLFETKILSSQILAGEEPGQDILVNKVRPSFRMAPESSARPNVEILVRSSHDPLMQFDVRSDTKTLDHADPNMWYPMNGLVGEYYIFRILFPELASQTIRDLRGFEIMYQPKAGRND